MPQDLSSEAVDLIRKLLQKDPKVRLGAKGAHEIKKQPFFKVLQENFKYNQLHYDSFLLISRVGALLINIDFVMLMSELNLTILLMHLSFLYQQTNL